MPAKPRAAAARSSRASRADGTRNAPTYELRISRLTIDKLGVKLYDKASAVVAELIANSYDADAETVTVQIPLHMQLATTAAGEVRDRGLRIVVEDDGYGMTPDEAKQFYLRVGEDRRKRPQHGNVSQFKRRPVMGRKGIGKLAPFGICRRIEIWSAGGRRTSKGYSVTNFFMDFDKIVADDDRPVPLDVGPDDRGWSPTSGTRITLTNFLAKRVPDEETFFRQLAMRFTFARPDFAIEVMDTNQPQPTARRLSPLDIPLYPGTRVDLNDRPVLKDDGTQLPVTGWLGMAKDAYKNEEMAGVRIYARGKIVGVTRDFDQPAGFTGEFMLRSYLVGEVRAEWLDLDDGEDLIRTDRQDILWDSEYGQYLRRWGAEAIKELARRTRQPRRTRARDLFLEKSHFEERAKKRFSDATIVGTATDLAKQFGGFAAEDELEDEEYVDALAEFILSVAPHHALILAFQEFSAQVTKGGVTLDHLVEIFDKTQIAELASYAQIAAERIRVIDELKAIIDEALDESRFQSLLATAPWLIEPSWTVITRNQSLKTFKDSFERFWKRKYGTDITLAIDYQAKRPDFTLISMDGRLHVVEIKKAGHDFDDNDFERMLNYVDGFAEFFKANKGLASNFPRGWVIDIVADGEKLKKAANKHAFDNVKKDNLVTRVTWIDFLDRAKKVHEQFLEARDIGLDRRNAKPLRALAGGKA